MTSLSVLAVALAVFCGFVLLEQRARRETVLNIVLGVLVLDVSLYPGYPGTTGLLQPSMAGHSVDLTSLLAVLGLVARLGILRRVVRRPPSRALWAAFLLWTLVAALHGLLQHHNLTSVLYEAEIVLHIGALGLLAAGVGMRLLAGRRGLTSLAWFAAPLALLAEIGHAAHVAIPGMGTVTVGEMGADAATVFASLGLVSLVIALSRDRPGRVDLVPAAVLVAAPLVANQRAALVGLVAALLVIVVGLVALRGRQMLVIGTKVAGPALLVVATLLAAGAFAAAATGSAAVTAGTSSVSGLTTTFTSTAKQQSAQSRLNQWRKALDVTEQAPLLGNGLGTLYVHYEVGSAALISSDITHDVPLDVAMRSGLVGLALLMAATLASLRDGIGALRSVGPPRVQAAVIGLLGVLAGLVARGTVESILEKHRLSILLGVVIGLLYAAASESVRSQSSATAADNAPVTFTDDPRSAAAWT